MASPKKPTFEVPSESKIAVFADTAHVNVGGNCVLITFYQQQVGDPEDKSSVTMVAAARVAMPAALAKSIADIVLSTLGDKQSG